SPDGSGEVEIEDRGSLPGVWSSNGKRLAFVTWINDAGEVVAPDKGWIRPALLTPGATNATVLIGRLGTRSPVPLAWSADQSRIFVYDGFDTPKQTDMGTFTISATDGGGETQLLSAPSDQLERPDFVLVSPNGKQLLVNRQEKGQGGEVVIFDPGAGNIF